MFILDGNAMLNILLKLRLASKSLETVFQGKTAALFEVIKYRRFILFGAVQRSISKIGEYDPNQKVKICKENT